MKFKIVLGLAMMAVGMLTLGISIYNNSGFEKYTIEYYETKPNDKETSLVYFVNTSTNETLEVVVDNKYIDRLNITSKYIVKRRENEANNIIEYRLSMPGIVDKISARFKLESQSSIKGSIITKDKESKVSITGGVKESYVITYGIADAKFKNTVDSNFFDRYSIGSDIPVKRNTFVNKEGYCIQQYKLEM